MNFRIYCEGDEFPKENVAALEKAMDGFVETDVTLAIEFLFVNGTEIRRLNRETRGIDKVTDVLSYPTLDGICGKPLYKKDFPYDLDEENRLLIGSVVVCRERAKEQAEEYGHSVDRELVYLFVHSMCHLVGYDHMEEDEKALMRAVEEKVMRALDLTRTK